MLVRTGRGRALKHETARGQTASDQRTSGLHDAPRKWQDRWLDHPFPTLSEPEKSVAYLTDLGDDDDHRAWLYNKASLQGGDSFFNPVRRRLSLLERPIHYAPYDPGNVAKLLDIMRPFITSF